MVVEELDCLRQHQSFKQAWFKTHNALLPFFKKEKTGKMLGVGHGILWAYNSYLFRKRMSNRKQPDAVKYFISTLFSCIEKTCKTFSYKI